MEAPIKPPFKEKDITVLDSMFKEFRSNKAVDKESPLFDIFLRTIGIRIEQVGGKPRLSFEWQEILEFEKAGGFRGHYNDYLAKVAIQESEEMKRKKEIADTKVSLHKAKTIKWEFWFSVAAVLISLAALAVSIFNH